MHLIYTFNINFLIKLIVYNWLHYIHFTHISYQISKTNLLINYMLQNQYDLKMPTIPMYYQLLKTTT